MQSLLHLSSYKIHHDSVQLDCAARAHQADDLQAL